MFFPLIGNQQLVQGGVHFTSARQLTISVSTSVSLVFSTAAVRGDHVAEIKMVLQSYNEGRRGRLPTIISFEYLTKLFTDSHLALL